MDPVTIGLIAMGALGKIGGIVGGKKRKQINPEELKRLFGAKAITSEQMELFNRAINSVQGQQLMTSAAQQGQQMQTDIARNAATAGLGPTGGATGGADIFAGAAGASATGNLQRAMQAQMMQAMLPIAQQLVSDRMRAWMGDRDAVLGQSTKFQDIMGSLAGLSGELLAAQQGSQAGQGQGGSTSTAGEQISGTGDAGANQAAMAANMAPAGVTPAGAGRTMAPAGVNPVVPLQPTMAGMGQANMLQGSGRFQRAMSARNRFGLVQAA